MFNIERFGIKSSPSLSSSPSLPSASSIPHNDEKKKTSNQSSEILEKILQKSRQRIHYKSYQTNQIYQNDKRTNDTQVISSKNKKSSQPLNIEKLLETDEEKRQRKLNAKLEKKKRKEQLKELIHDNENIVGEEEEKEKERLQQETEENVEDVDVLNEENDSHGDDDHEDQNDDDVLQDENQGVNVIEKESLSEQLSYTPIALPNENQSTDKAKVQSALIPPAIVIKENVTILDSIKKWGVDTKLANDIIEDGIEEYFPVQVAVIPLLLAHSNYQPFALPRDMIVSAPTGSGKTLAYALPIIQTLSTAQRLCSHLRPQRRLHALIILPSRELVSQVYQVFCRLARNTTLRIGQASGQVDLSIEKSMLVSTTSKFSPVLGSISQEGSPNYNTSLIDILICTPGRLLEHLQSTDGFTLQHLKYIVFDEADRLLSNAYDHWVRALMSSTSTKSNQFLQLHHMSHSDSNSQVKGVPLSSSLGGHSQYSDHIPHIQRLMFSATLTDNPRKLSLSGVRNPLIIRTTASTPYTSEHEDPQNSSDGLTNIEYTLPRGLKEWLCICDTASRPLYLLAILYQICGLIPISESSYSLSNICSKPEDLILIFTSSVETTHRLCRLLQLFNNQFQHLFNPCDDDNTSSSALFGGQIQEINRMIPSAKRTEILQLARQGSIIKILISSDQLTRGIDLQNVRVVINYDSPSHPRTYVHRVGRTARANRVGDCITMIKKGNITQFQKMRNEISSIFKESSSNGQKQKINMDRIHISWKGFILSSLKGTKGSGNKRKRDHDDEGEMKEKEENSDYQQFFHQYQYALRHLNDILELENQHQLKIGEC